MRIVTPTSLRELSVAGRKKIESMRALWDVLDQCAHEIESRDAQIEGLKLALASPKVGAP